MSLNAAGHAALGVVDVMRGLADIHIEMRRIRSVRRKNGSHGSQGLTEVVMNPSRHAFRSIDSSARGFQSATHWHATSRVAFAALFTVSLSAGAADLPKQGSFALTHTVAATSPAAFDTGSGKWAAIFDARVISTNDAGSGMFHNLAGHCIGFDMAGRLTGTCLWMDVDGDKFSETINREAGSSKGTGTLIGGTGKYTGIEGSLEFVEAPPLASAAPNQRNLISKVKGSYKIP